MVLAQQFTRHIAGWSAFARKCRQALLPGRNAFAHLDQAIHLPKSVTCPTLVLIFLSPSRFSTVHPWRLWTAGTSKGRKNRLRSKNLDTSLIEPRHSRRKSRRNTPVVGD